MQPSLYVFLIATLTPLVLNVSSLNIFRRQLLTAKKKISQMTRFEISANRQHQVQ